MFFRLSGGRALADALAVFPKDRWRRPQLDRAAPSRLPLNRSVSCPRGVSLVTAFGDFQGDFRIYVPIRPKHARKIRLPSRNDRVESTRIFRDIAADPASRPEGRNIAAPFPPLPQAAPLNVLSRDSRALRVTRCLSGQLPHRLTVPSRPFHCARR